jgi:hypothetical protein
MLCMLYEFSYPDLELAQQSRLRVQQKVAAPPAPQRCIKFNDAIIPLNKLLN